MDSSVLPDPSAEALAASRRLTGDLRADISAAGGWIGFDRYLETVLYRPALGYYSGGSRKFGAAGDFVTAPETSPLFGACIATQVAQWFEAVAHDVIEFGAGSGAMAAQVLNELTRLGARDVTYRIVELSGELRDRQRRTIEMLAPAQVDRVRWLDRMPDVLSGVVLANELLDAMPVRLFHLQRGELFERGVAAADDPPGGRDFCWQDRPADAGFTAEVRATLAAADWPAGVGDPDDYVSELGLVGRGWVESIVERMDRAVMLVIDYGFPSREYYHPQRARGTLMCHYRHRSHGDPFWLPGLQDITAHVDFGAIAAAAQARGAGLLGYTSQANFLVNCGLIDMLAKLPRSGYLIDAKRSQAVHRLVSEAEMGELFKVLAVAVADVGESIGFSQRDRSFALRSADRC
jgi:SAM-dependent MidA family methyltransferase